MIITNPDQKQTKDSHAKATFKAIYLRPAKGQGLSFYLRKYPNGKSKILTSKHMAVDTAVPQPLSDNVIINSGEDDIEETKYKKYIFSIFQKIDALNIISISVNTNWFLELNFHKLFQQKVPLSFFQYNFETD